MIKNLSKRMKPSNRPGVAPIVVLLFILLFIGVLLGLDYGYVYLLGRCGDAPFVQCLNEKEEDKKADTPAEETEKKTPVTATGEIAVKEYAAVVSVNFPLEGGVVTGSVTGDCSGKVSGNYAGGDNGVISGKIFGSCSPFYVPIPASATFSGTVNQQQKTVDITGTGGAAGFSGSRSVSLSY